MKELIEYRVKLIARLMEAAREFRSACESYSNPFIPIEGEWTLHQIASHTRDVDRMVYGTRIRRTLHEENPEFKSFDADAWMAEHYNKEEPLVNILDEFSANMDGLCKTLESLPREGWSRESRHETQGGELTLQLWVERSLAHVEEHLQSARYAKK
ncbi:MAG: DinB family protein [Anaerolineales bacterium]|nr:MAG: DinB family protein [Anaerolineales bacterium]